VINAAANSEFTGNCFKSSDNSVSCKYIFN
jgi:hypothetical protein